MIELPRPSLCLVTDRRAVAPDARTIPAQLAALERLVDEALEAGIDMLQIREGDLPARDLQGLVARIAARARGPARTVVLVNDRADVALSIQGVGLHLKSDGPPVSVVRSLAGAGRVIGRSTHDPIDVRVVDGADFLVFGTVFPSGSKPPGAVAAGVGALRRACAAVSVPVLAIGGVRPDRVADCRRAGAAGIAAIGIFLPPGRAPGALGPRNAALALRDAWQDTPPINYS
jgi:thiamine-phosphate pyrophosphorylase